MKNKNKLGRPQKSEKDKKTSIIRFLVTKKDFEIYNMRKNRLLEHSPTLLASDIFRSVALNIDDKALIQFFKLDKNDPIRIYLINEFQMSQK